MIIGTLGQCSAFYANSSSNTSNKSTTSQQSSTSSNNSSSSSYSGSSSYSSSKSGSSSGGEYHDDWISWQDAHKYIGQGASVRGVVKSVRTQETKSGTATFINIGADYPDKNRVTAVIWGNNRANFESSWGSQFLSSSLEGKTVCVSGYVENYQGAAEIELVGYWQIHEVYR